MQRYFLLGTFSEKEIIIKHIIFNSKDHIYSAYSKKYIAKSLLEIIRSAIDKKFIWATRKVKTIVEIEETSNVLKWNIVKIYSIDSEEIQKILLLI